MVDKNIIGMINTPLVVNVIRDTYVRNGEKEERKTLAWAPCKLTYLTDNP